MTRTFKQLFCEHFECSPGDFSREILVRSVYPHALPLLKPLLFLEVSALQEGLALLDEVGQSTAPDEVDDAIISYQRRLRQNEGAVMGRLKLRISCNRLLDVYRSVSNANMPEQLPLFDPPAKNVIAFPERDIAPANSQPNESPSTARGTELAI